MTIPKEVMMYLTREELGQVYTWLEVVNQLQNNGNPTPLSLEIKFWDSNGEEIGKIGYAENSDYSFIYNEESKEL